MYKKKFNLYIDTFIETELIKKANEIAEKYVSCLNFSTIDDLQLIIVGGYLEGRGFYEFEAKLLKNTQETIAYYSDYSIDIIDNSICNYLYEKISRLLAIQWVQNDTKQKLYLTSEKILCTNFINVVQTIKQEYPPEIIIEVKLSIEECQHIINKNLRELIFYFFQEVLDDKKAVELDTDYTSDEKIMALDNTKKKLEKMNSHINDTEFQFFINRFSNTNKGKHYLLDRMKDADCNYLCCDEEFGLVYIHIINLVYGVFNIKHKLDIHETKIKPLLHVSKSDLSELNIKIANLHSNLISYKEQVDKNRIIQYVYRYYYSKKLFYLPDNDKFTLFIASLFKREPNKLRDEKKLTMETIARPFNFLYYQAWEQFYYPTIKTYPKSIPLKYLCEELRKPKLL